MPLTKQAIKKMYHDQVVEKHNEGGRTALKKVVKLHRRTPTASSLQKAFSLLDKSAKRNLIHKNKASRLKSRLSKLVAAK